MRKVVVFIYTESAAKCQQIISETRHCAMNQHVQQNMLCSRKPCVIYQAVLLL